MSPQCVGEITQIKVKGQVQGHKINVSSYVSECHVDFKHIYARTDAIAYSKRYAQFTIPFEI